MNRTLSRALRAVAMTAAVTLASTAPASADTVYPVGANTFSDGIQGWDGSSKSCSLTPLSEISDALVDLLGGGSVPGVVCTVENEHSSDGKPAGSLSTTYRPVAGLPVLTSGQGTWLSPSFTLNSAATGEAVFSMDAKAAVQALADVTGEAAVTVNLIDASKPAASQRKKIAEKTLTGADTTFTTVTSTPGSIPVDTFGPGTGPFQLEIVTEFSGLQVADTINRVFYDNVKLSVTDNAGPVGVPSVTTLNATNISKNAATLNSLVNPKGVPTQARFEYGETTAYGLQTTLNDLGAGTIPTSFPQPIAGLEPCKTYHFRVVATYPTPATDDDPLATTTKAGDDAQFSTFCSPKATTFPATGIGGSSAQLNAAVLPNGPATQYRYEWGTAPDQLSNNAPIQLADAGSGTEPKQPLTIPIDGLAEQTTYYFRVYAVNEIGEARGDVKSFTTPKATGTTGQGGATGTAGPPGANGVVGSALTNLVLNNGDERSLLRIRSKFVKVGQKGRRRGMVRLPIFCKAKTGRTCAGTVKVRTIGTLVPNTVGKPKPKRRVTFITFEYQLARSKSGFALGQISQEKLNLLERIKSAKVQISVQVTDALGNRQTIVRNGVIVLRKTI